jgi:Orthoreovirus membrane fusion protein p10.
MTKELTKKITIISNIVVVILTIVILICCYLSFKADQVTQIPSESVVYLSDSQQYSYSIDTVRIQTTEQSNGRNCFYINGWFIEEGVPSGHSKFNIVLRSVNTGDYYRIPTKILVRSDVTKNLNDGINYNQSGFMCYIPLEELFHENDYNYNIIFEIRDGDSDIFVNPNVNILNYLK